MAELISDNDTFVEYRYKIDEFIIIIGEKQIEVPAAHIMGFSIEHHYETWVLPLFKITLRIKHQTYYKILKNKDTVTFKVRIQRFYTKGNNEKNTSLSKDYINDTFCIFTDNDTSDLEQNLRKKTGSDKDRTADLQDMSNVVDLFLFKKEITKLRSTFAAVVNGNMANIVGLLLDKSEMTDTLISPFDNNNGYLDVCIPPIRIDQALELLNNTYGFHKKGTIIYFGLVNNYILDYKKGCTAYRKKEWQETVIVVMDNSDSNVGGLTGGFLKKNEKKFYFNVPPRNLDMSNTSVVANVLGGVDVTTVSSVSNKSTKNKSEAKVKDSANEQVIPNATKNEYLGTALAAQKKASEMVVTMIIENANIEAFHPNKDISMVFEDSSSHKKYEGHYHAIQAIHDFKQSGEYYTVSSFITLRRKGK